MDAVFVVGVAAELLQHFLVQRDTWLPAHAFVQQGLHAWNVKLKANLFYICCRERFMV